ncbi:MAG: AzlD domain-containing protein [Agathobacter sp.]|nr:AzlD domain-containing protein [Agathobacter sp.]
MSVGKFFTYLAVMAGVTYLIRAIPLALCRGKVKNVFIKSFLAYIPYAVLGAMTFPAIIYSTDGIASGIAGTITGLILAYRRKSLLLVAVASCAAAFAVEIIQYLIPLL